MRVNIIYEVNNREFNNCLLLQRELVRRGHDARIYNKTEDILLTDNSNSVTLIPNSYRNEDLAHYRYCFNTNGGLIVIYPCEQVTNHFLPTFFDHSDNNEVKKLPHLCWSIDYSEFLGSVGFDTNVLKIVGAIQLDFCRPEFKRFYVSREHLSNKYALPNKKKWMLFISDFVLDNDEKYNRLLESGDVEETVLTKRRSHERASTRIILEWFDKFLDLHPEYILIYRKHPVEILSESIVEFQNRHEHQVFCISEYGIKDWIMNCDRIVTWNSTSAVECFVAMKNIHLLRPIPFDDNSGYKEYSFYQAMKGITSFAQFESSIINDCYGYNKDFIEEINKLYSIDETPSYLRVSDAIEEFYSSYRNGSVSKRFKRDRAFYLLKNVIIPKILVKKFLQSIYLILGIRFGKQTEKGVSINEWMATADNRRDMKKRSRLIDDIIKNGEVKNGKISN